MSFIKIDRDILSSYCFANANHLKIWLWLLVKANYKKAFVPLKIGIGYTTVEVNRGQLLFGRHKAEEELGIDGSLIYRVLNKFEELGQINIVSNNQYSIITICKYDTYQSYDKDDEQPLNNQRTSNEQPMNNRRTTDEQQMNTYKEELEEIEEKRINIDFDVFWELYDKKKGERSKLISKWSKLSDQERELIMDYIPKYKIAQPDKKFRKDPQTFLNNKSWLDEIIPSKNAESGYNGLKTAQKSDYQLEYERQKELYRNKSYEI
jgi:hypothetical protein